MNVLSLFDGISCGQLALQRAGIKVEKYYASEINKHAIQVAQKNFPETIQIGDVNNINFLKYRGKIDLLIGGSPCQGFSNSGKGLNFDDPRSKLFFKFVEALHTVQPKYFLLENVTMKKEWEDTITSFLGVEPVVINSSLVSAQNRERLYWTNIPNIEQPEDKHIYLKDILETEGIVGRVVGRRIKDGKRADYDYSIKPVQMFEPRLDNKSGTLTTVQKDNMVLEIRDKSKCVRSGGRNSVDRHEWDSVYKNSHHRKLTVLECERLQTLPDNYTEGVSNTQRYKMIGNGWTVDVIAHIFSYLKIDK